MAQAVCEMGYWLPYTPYIRMMGAAAFYLEYAVAKLPRTHPQSLLAAQALCIARLNVADTVGQSIAAIEAAVALESERFGALSGPRERYLHHHIRERLHARAGNSVEAQTAHNLAVTAYQELRQFGEPALFGDALVISLLNFDFAMGGIQKGNLSHTGTSLAATDTVRLLIRTEAHDQLTAVLSGTADWNTLFATLQSPATLLEAEALEAAVKNAEAS